MPKSNFDYESFYKFAKKFAKENKNIYVSEYAMPVDFECIFEIEKKCTLSDCNRKSTIEKLFVPKYE